MKYALVKVTKTWWIVAQESEVCKGEFRAVTPRLIEAVARKVYDELRIVGWERVSEEVRAWLL